MDIILASQSPRRKELLGQMGLRGFKITSPEVDETVEEHMPPAQVVEELSRRKALAVAGHADPDDLIIAADTVVALEGAVLGKPVMEAYLLDAWTLSEFFGGLEKESIHCAMMAALALKTALRNYAETRRRAG